MTIRKPQEIQCACRIRGAHRVRARDIKGGRSSMRPLATACRQESNSQETGNPTWSQKSRVRPIRVLEKRTNSSTLSRKDRGTPEPYSMTMGVVGPGDWDEMPAKRKTRRKSTSN